MDNWQVVQDEINNVKEYAAQHTDGTKYGPFATRSGAQKVCNNRNLINYPGSVPARREDEK